MKEAISKRKSELMEQRVIDCEGDQKKLFSLIHSLLGSKNNTVLPEYTNSFTLASTINMSFIDKMSTIKMEFPLLEAWLPIYIFVDIDIIMPCKSSIIFPLIKKQCLDPEILKNYRPVANLLFISKKIIEKTIATQIHNHLINNDIVDNFQSAYKAGHSCETALLRVYNDIVTTIGRGNGDMLVLLDYQQLLIQLIMITFFEFLKNM